MHWGFGPGLGHLFPCQDQSFHGVKFIDCLLSSFWWLWEHGFEFLEGEVLFITLNLSVSCHYNLVEVRVKSWLKPVLICARFSCCLAPVRLLSSGSPMGKNFLEGELSLWVKPRVALDLVSHFNWPPFDEPLHPWEESLWVKRIGLRSWLDEA